MMPTSKLNKKKIGITIGDPTGIGPEVIAKALKIPAILKLSDFTIIGDEPAFKKYFKQLNPRHHLLAIDKIYNHQSAGEKSYLYLQKAVDLLKSKDITALVTAPVSKENIGKNRPDFVGHTEFLADQFNIKNVGMLFVAKAMRTIIVTRHIALNKVSAALTKDLIVKTIILTNDALKNNFKIRNPRIAVCGLNPHAGEGGTIGQEEINTVIPALKRAKRDNIDCRGPYAADTLFTKNNSKNYDAIVAMYHDQGLIPIKTLYFHELVNMTIGLPFIRTSPAHGTAFDIAGKNKADPSSMIEAIKLAAQLS